MKFPRYTKEQDCRCKLNDEQIQVIRDRRHFGETYASIAKDFNITEQAVYYWCLSSEIKKLKNKNHKQNPRDTKKYLLEYRKRKLKLNPEVKLYENFSNIRYRLKYPEKVKISQSKSDKKYRLAHSEEIKKRMKLWQLKNLNKFREYNRKCREKKKLVHK
jgi:hypothetical protein